MNANSRTGGLFRAFETAGQAVSYAINSHTGSDARIGFYVNCAVLIITIPCMVGLIKMVPEAPAAVDTDVLDAPIIEGVAKTD